MTKRPYDSNSCRSMLVVGSGHDLVTKKPRLSRTPSSTSVSSCVDKRGDDFKMAAYKKGSFVDDEKLKTLALLSSKFVSMMEHRQTVQYQESATNLRSSSSSSSRGSSPSPPLATKPQLPRLIQYPLNSAIPPPRYDYLASMVILPKTSDHNNAGGAITNSQTSTSIQRLEGSTTANMNRNSRSSKGYMSTKFLPINRYSKNINFHKPLPNPPPILYYAPKSKKE
jgi:hypothetical protein